jgi:hypothetical protein
VKRKIFSILFATVLVLSLTLVSAVPVVAAAGPDPVDLGTAGNFAILAKSGITTTGTTSIVGDIGVSPITYASITGFALTPVTPDGTNTFATSPLVTGKVYAADYTEPTPTNLGIAVLDMEAAYTDATGRTLPDATELGEGNISGMTLAPGLYKWSTGLLIDNTGVTLEGGANDVWIFQIAGTLTVANDAHVNLIGGAQAENIFWAVADVNALGSASVFNGNILAQTNITMTDGATLNGRALAQTNVTLIGNTITAPGGGAADNTNSGTGDVLGDVVISSTDIEGPYVVSIEQGFSVTTTSASEYALVRFNFVAADAVLADIASFQYSEDGLTWYAMPLSQDGDNVVGYFGPETGFLMTAPYDVTTLFKVEFSVAKTYPVTISLVDMPDETDIQSAEFSLVVGALVPSTISIAAPGDFSFGTFDIGEDNNANGTSGAVTYNAGNDGATTDWHVTARDNNTGTDTGKMLRTTDSHPLTSELGISGDGGSIYEPADTGITYEGSGPGALTFDAQQNIASGEYAGTYAITIKFVGSLGF